MVARLVLAMLVFPAGAGAFLLILVSLVRRGGPPPIVGIVMDCAVVFVFVAVYWILLWRSVVRWTRRRIWRTCGATVLAVTMGLAGGAVFAALNPRLPLFFPVTAVGGSVVILWLLLTVLLWRETARVRIERLAGEGQITVACPACGYSLASLREARCPEYGTVFTLEQLVSVQ